QITALPSHGELFKGNSTAAADKIAAVPTMIPSSATSADVTYKPAANYNGPDSLQFPPNDGFTQSTPATVAVTDAPVTDAPVATSDSYTTAEDTPLSPTASGVLANDTDVDGDTLSAKLVTGPVHGTLALNANGSFTYTPNANYNGSDSFTYRANDGTADSNV